MADLYLVRHGQTELNVQNILQGWHDSPLTARGREQALATRAAFEARGISFDHAYSSPLGRARHTAGLIVGEDLPIKPVDDLREQRCPVLWLDRSTIVCLQSLMALPARSFLDAWPAGEDSPTTVPCFILAIATGRFRSLTGNERKDPYE